MTQEYLGIVEVVVTTKGGNNRYARATVANIGVVTFSLQPPVWQEDMPSPERGTYVVMSNIYRKKGGWRAERCRLLRPGDAIATEVKE